MKLRKEKSAEPLKDFQNHVLLLVVVFVPLALVSNEASAEVTLWAFWSLLVVTYIMRKLIEK